MLWYTVLLSLEDTCLFVLCKSVGEVVCADVEAAASYPDDPAQKVNEGGNSQQQISTVTETVL